jgi:glycosyltransferase involved in cell wall biosynthesis
VDYDGVIVTDLITLADFRALVSGPPVLLYMHESQMTYPLPKGKTVETDTALADIRNVLMADRVLFNSRFHRGRFLEVAGDVLAGAPSDEPAGLVSALEARSAVLHPGCELTDAACGENSGHGAAGAWAHAAGTVTGGRQPQDGPLVVWNHRWEYDKNPTPFFRSLERLAAEGVGFRLALLGENPQYHPREFEAAWESLRPHIVRYGYVPERSDYAALLRSADIVVSTSLQENFGISIVEAVAAGCIPLLPKRLSYPEIIPPKYHDRCLYGSNRELLEKLRRFLTGGLPELPGLAEAMLRYDWSRLAPLYDRELDALAERPGRTEAPD